MMGPLDGYKIVELAGIGPGPMCAMLLAELGAEVISVDRIQEAGLGVGMPTRFNLLRRSRRSVAVDLKKPQGVATVMRLIERADALIEGFRPGVTERLGLGPQDCAARNPRLVYGRVTGWGQDGPLAQAAGHDLNYIALCGALHSIGRRDQPPTPPLNLVGDFGGGALYLALGVVAALLEARESGQGQTVDAAMVDGAASLMTAAYALHAAGVTNNHRGDNVLDSGAHFYDVYETSDGRYIALAAIEGKFYARLLELTGISPEELPHSRDRREWPQLKARLAAVIKTKTRDEWCELLEGTDACFAPVLDLDEAHRHPHNRARQTFASVDDVVQPNPAPRFSRTPTEIKGPPSAPGGQTDAVLADWGFSEAEIAQLRETSVIGAAPSTATP
jgi:alpha-methylacyl-CoA racemase